jgi:two-component system response regulator AtoC
MNSPNSSVQEVEKACPMSILSPNLLPDDVPLPTACSSSRILDMAAQDVAGSKTPVLILGEPGTGKRSLAFRIHQLSPRSDASMLQVECDQLLPERCSIADLVSEARSFSNNRIGTILFFEIAKLDLASQFRLYESLLEYLPEMPGEATPRLIFTSSHNLEHEVRAGRFREDLYYQISYTSLRIPPLRHRRQDISDLLDRFLIKYAALLGRPKPQISQSTVRFLSDYSWPGNISELEDAGRTIAALGDERVAMMAFSAQRKSKRQNGKAETVSLREVSRAASRAAEKDLILKVLSRTQGNRKRAALDLKISYKALLYKLKQIETRQPSPAVDRELES